MPQKGARAVASVHRGGHVAGILQLPRSGRLTLDLFDERTLKALVDFGPERRQVGVALGPGDQIEPISHPEG